MEQNGNALGMVRQGKIEDAAKRLATVRPVQWSSLPGGKEANGFTEADMMESYNQFFSRTEMINRYKSEYIYSITRQILALLILSPIFSAQATTAKNICNKFSQNKSMQAFLFDSLGKQELPYFDLGKLDATTSEQNEYLVAKKFRLVIYPNYIQPESLGGKTLFLISRK